ncbi:hypothetical protein [Bradyrhizobium sp. sBnM-33]|uniref:hypothetical protein n=1 Tax=Bradyrhizobium sp. sBnM-33 TaxID=2831780 RepID=UPI001BCA8C0B|nr:hypothetical protein [Bradyrhizobium sp. sBnM-33]WOH53341.1 hypothetical protein RX328_15395 [Bradyrhizobium sp. sBnM-33]
MCAKCKNLEERIESARHIADRVPDQSMIDTYQRLISALEAEKVTLHPPQCDGG